MGTGRGGITSAVTSTLKPEPLTASAPGTTWAPATVESARRAHLDGTAACGPACLLAWQRKVSGRE